MSLQNIEIDLEEMEKEMKKFHVKRLKFALNKVQINELLDNAFEKNFRHYLMMRVQLECALRVGELVNLRVENINFITKEISIEEYRINKEVVWNPKYNSIRPIGISEELCKELKRYLNSRKSKKHVYVFQSNKDEQYDTKSVIRFINKYAKSCPSIGKTIGSHALRRTMASYLFSKKIDLLKLSKILGHKETSTTLRYIFEIDKRDFDDVRQAIKEMY